MEIGKTFRFEASHILPNHPGKCSRLHGHSWVLSVYVDGPVDPSTGFVMDYGDISRLVSPLIIELDHYHLGTYSSGSLLRWKSPCLPIDIYPTSENLLLWMGSYMTKILPWSRLILQETCTSAAEIRRKDILYGNQ